MVIRIVLNTCEIQINCVVLYPNDPDGASFINTQTGTFWKSIDQISLKQPQQVSNTANMLADAAATMIPTSQTASQQTSQPVS